VSSVTTRLESVIEGSELDYRDVARIVDASPRSVARWVSTDTEPRRASRERLLELFAVIERLQAVVRPAAAHDWLYTPNPTLDNEKPADLLRHGEYRRVLAIIDALGEGVFV
jgi:uncharacterized protein (DUF2384 family)